MFERRLELLDTVDHACFQCIHMAKRIRAESNHPALRWKLSEEAKQRIAEIDRNARTALQRIGHIVVGTKI